VYKIYGKVRDYDGNPLSGADVLIKNKSFEDLFSSVSDENGNYEVTVEAGTYEAIGIFKDYPDKMLEYWGWHIKVDGNFELDVRINRLEVYGMNVYRVQGGYPSLSIYFRPMSLPMLNRIKQKEDIQALKLLDIAPELSISSIKAYVNHKRVEVLEVSKVRERVGQDQTMFAYIVQVDLPDGFDEDHNNFVTLDICDSESKDFGMGTVWF